MMSKDKEVQTYEWTKGNRGTTRFTSLTNNRAKWVPQIAKMQYRANRETWATNNNKAQFSALKVKIDNL